MSRPLPASYGCFPEPWVYKDLLGISVVLTMGRVGAGEKGLKEGNMKETLKKSGMTTWKSYSQT